VVILQKKVAKNAGRFWEKYVKKIVQKIVKIPVGLPVAPGISENLFHILNTVCLFYTFV